MATDNPTGRGYAVALQLPAAHARFLRGAFEMTRDGIKVELAEHPDRLQDPARLRREEAAYGRLLKALEERVIVPDDDVRAVLRQLAKTIDATNEYERVVCEHEALHGLLARLAEGQGR